MNLSTRNFPSIILICISLALINFSYVCFAQEEKHTPAKVEEEKPQPLKVEEEKPKQVSTEDDKNQSEQTIEKKIFSATRSFYSEQIVGWQYKNKSTKKWTKGTKEESLGKPKYHEEDVRAIALGIEGEFIVFFTLRSFVDPLYPNSAIQGLNCPIKGKNSKDIDLKKATRHDYIRYSFFQLSINSVSGDITDLVEFVTEFDNEIPKNYEDTGYFGSKPTQIYKEIPYEVPHEEISVEQHFKYKEMGTKFLAEMKFFDNHDVVLIYVPTILFKELPFTLGMKNPTCATDLALSRSSELFGFKFNLIGDETLEKIKEYVPPEGKGKYPGAEKLFDIIGLALDPTTFQMLLAVDSLVDKCVPKSDKLKIAIDASRVTASQMNDIASGLMKLKKLYIDQKK